MKNKLQTFMAILVFGLSVITVVYFTVRSHFTDDISDFTEIIELTMSVDEPSKKSISCFDVSDSGNIALGHDCFNRKVISIYSDNGIFQRSYSFKCSGSFAVEFDNSDQETIKILFVRANVVASVDSSGIITGIEKVVDDAPLIDRLHSIRRTIGNSQYTLRNDMGILNLFAMSHSQLVVESANGEEQIIYDASSAHIRNMIAAVICIVAFVTVVTVGVIREFIKARRRFNIAEQTV